MVCMKLIEKVLIVEGRQDCLQLKPILNEPVEIVCTNGTVSSHRLDELLQPYESCDFYAFFDADDMGEKLRKLVQQEYPNTHHLYTLPRYGGVERTPRYHLAKVLQGAKFKIKSGYLLDKG